MKREVTSALLVLFVAVALAASGCAKKAKPDADQSTSTPMQDSSVQSGGIHDSDSQNADGLVTVHFAFDSDELDAHAKSVLNSNAQILRDHSSLSVQIEGHCDQRGGIQFNLALGDRRAHKVQKYLSLKGVPLSRMATISMGKEKPIDTAETEEAYAKNRRGNFVITQQ